jgi:hypothetical protein
MATAAEYADWIVKNEARKGTPEFDTVAAAYKAARQSETTQPREASQSLGDVIRDIPRQAGLVGRSVVNAAAALPAMGADAIGGFYNAGADLVAGKGNGPRFQQTMPALNALMTSAGVPEPRNANERVATDAGTLLLGAGGVSRGANMLADGAQGITRNVLNSFAARPVVQGAGAVGSGVAGGSVREAGGSDAEQLTASLAGGVAGGLGADKIERGVRSAGNALARMLTPRAVELQRADQQISLTLQRSGIDWSSVPEGIRQNMREEAAAALSNGQPLNAGALRRMLVFQRTGTTPTVGQLTQNPGQITREKNLAKTGANSTDPSLQALPELENRNVSTLLQGLDDAGAANAPSMAETGSRVINSLDRNLQSAGASRDALYAAARDSEGRSVVLNGPAAAQVAARRLQQDLAGKLPPEIDKVLNDLTTGATPLTVDYQQQLVRALGERIRGAGADGTLRHGLGIVRSALDNAEVIATNPGNLPVPLGVVTPPGQQAGREAIAGFQRARSAHRELMARIEANPALSAVADGVEPDQFIQRYVIGKGATVADVQALRNELSPEAAQSMRQTLVRYLRDKATGGDADIIKFGGKTYRDAFRDIQDKLPAFFSREEIQQMRDIGDAAKYMQSQPAGAAVNNSNSGALVLGRGLDTLERIAQKLPIGRDAISGVIQGLQQRQIIAPRNALQTFAQPAQGARVNPLMSLALPAQAREDNRRNAPP